MSLSIGNKTCTTGLSKRVYDTLAAEWLAAFGWNISTEPAQTRQIYQLFCYSVAKGVVDEIQANAALNGALATIGIADAGLQRDNTAGNPATLAPAAPVTVPVTGGIT